MLAFGIVVIISINISSGDGKEIAILSHFLKHEVFITVQAVQCNLFSFGFFLSCFSLLSLSLPLLVLASKSTSLSPRFCVCRSRQYDTICWELNFISGLLFFLWLIVWVDEINSVVWIVNPCNFFVWSNSYTFLESLLT